MGAVEYLFWGMAFGFILSVPVGPVNMLCLQRGLRGHPLDAFLIGVAAAVGDAIFAALSAFSVDLMRGLFLAHDRILAVAGGLIMMGFALHIWRSHPHMTPEEGTSARHGTIRSMAATLALTLSNPGIFVGLVGLYSAVGIGDLGAGGGKAHLEGLSLVAGVFLGASLWWLLLASLANRMRERISDRHLEWINRGSAILILCFAFFAFFSLLA